MNLTANKTPTHEIVYRQIREMVLFGEVAPGQAITIQGMVRELGAGMTPVREAIRRLIAEGALEFLGNRRICLPAMNLAKLEEVAFARNVIEPRLAYLASKNAKPKDIYRLENTDDLINSAISQGNVRAYLENNYRFHETLYEMSQAHVLIDVSAGLWLRVGPSLRVVVGRYGTRNLPDMHEEALAALRSQDHEGVAAAILGDIGQGHDQIRHSLLDQKV